MTESFTPYWSARCASEERDCGHERIAHNTVTPMKWCNFPGCPCPDFIPPTNATVLGATVLGATDD